MEPKIYTHEELHKLDPAKLISHDGHREMTVLEVIRRCRRDLCWNLIGGLRSDEDTWSGSKVNRVIGEFLGQALPSVHFAHNDLT